MANPKLCDNNEPIFCECIRKTDKKQKHIRQQNEEKIQNKIMNDSAD